MKNIFIKKSDSELGSVNIWAIISIIISIIIATALLKFAKDYGRVGIKKTDEAAEQLAKLKEEIKSR